MHSSHTGLASFSTLLGQAGACNFESAMLAETPLSQEQSSRSMRPTLAEEALKNQPRKKGVRHPVKPRDHGPLGIGLSLPPMEAGQGAPSDLTL
mmetsp:Transcript_53539/g.124715  ORF Transcript_53539/g.124715 Transcript_53539/m.124715 type:complete len:94 (-) Transcript_53539:123-404(-)